MAANMTVVTNLLNGRRVGRFANRKTLSNDETIQEAIDGGYVVGETGDYDGVITVTLVDKDDEETTDTVDIPVHFHAEEH